MFEKYSYTRTKNEAGYALRKATQDGHYTQKTEQGEQSAAAYAFDPA